MIYLVRHGQTEFNAAGRMQGRRDSALTPLGIDQARRLGRLLGPLIPPGSRIIASPLGRALHTAELIREEARFPGGVIRDERLAEIGLGEWEGMLKAEVRAMYPSFDDDQRQWDWFFSAPGGESYDAMVHRLSGWLDEVRAHPGTTIAVSHGVAGRILRGLFLNLPKDEALRLEIPQDACFRLSGGSIERMACF